jgi:hypothetical protein
MLRNCKTGTPARLASPSRRGTGQKWPSYYDFKTRSYDPGTAFTPFLHFENVVCNERANRFVQRSSASCVVARAQFSRGAYVVSNDVADGRQFGAMFPLP